MSRRSRHVGGYILRNGMFAPSLVKSIQRGTLSFTGTSSTATINAVSTQNSILVVTVRDADTTSLDITAMRAELTNTTTITGYRNTASAGSGGVIAYQVIEYFPGVIKTVQRGTLTTTASSSGTATVTAVNTNKAFVVDLFFTTTYNATKENSYMVGTHVLTNATTVTFTSLSAMDRTVGYQVVELY